MVWKAPLLWAVVTVAVLLSGGAAAYAVLADSGSGAASSPGGVAGIVLPPPTPTVSLPPVNTRANIDAELASDAPALKAAIAAIEADNVDAMFGLMTWKQFACTAESAKGGIAPKCTELGLAEGAMVPMFHYELLAYSYFTQAQMRTELAPLLDGQSPALGLVARRPDGTGRISFTVNDTAKTGLRGIDFTVDFNSPTPLVSYTERFVSSTPLDTLRQDEYMRGLPASQILYVSPALLKWEQEKTQAQSNPRPGPGVTPSP